MWWVRICKPAHLSDKVFLGAQLVQVAQETLILQPLLHFIFPSSTWRPHGQLICDVHVLLLGLGGDPIM